MKKNYIQLGNEAYRKGNYEIALSYYREALKLNPKLKNIINLNFQLCISKKSYKNSNLTDLNTSPTQKKILLRLESISLNGATGWAVSEKGEDEPIFVLSSINNRPAYISDTHKMRGDVKKIYGGDGYCGYNIELNEYLDFNGNSLLSVSPLKDSLASNNRPELHKKYIPKLLNGQHFADINYRAKLILESRIFKEPEYSKQGEIQKLVSIIILNLNGIDVLQDCIKSVVDKVKVKFEIIIVDHGSSDGSIDYLNSINDPRIEIIKREENYSFSASNNYAAKQAKGDYLVFMNNDMIIDDDVISKMMNILSKTSFGLLGVKLWDMPHRLDFNHAMQLKVVQHIGVHFKDCNRSNYIEAYESRPTTYFDENLKGIYETPAVTAAIMMVSSQDFNKIGGFNERYFYGQEDVDFCLNYLKSDLGKIGVILDSGVYHARGLSRRVLSSTGKNYIKNNRAILQEEQSSWFRRTLRKDKINKIGYWNPKPYTIAMIVSEISFETDKADYFTARELGNAIELNREFVVGYFSAEEKDINLNGYDAVIVFIDNFNILNLKGISPDILIIGWARNWFDRWCERYWISAYDILFASSDYSRDYMEKRLQRRVRLMRIAASSACVKVTSRDFKPEYQSDYTFTGSYFGSPREITNFLKPEKLPYKFNLYGHNWDKHASFSNYTKGPISYEEIPYVYSSTKLVVDDANIATKEWGALNCRIYDSLAAGVICITNNSLGVSEIFERDYPVYSDNASLNNHIESFLQNEPLRTELSKKYKQIIISEHTYISRAKQLFSELRTHQQRIRIGIKISAPELSKSKSWGDYYFALALAKHFEKLDYSVRIDCMDQWYSPRTQADDVVLVIRGLDRYIPRDGQLNLLWIISHPEKVSLSEIKQFNHVCVASEHYTEKLKSFSNLKNIETLLQATDFSTKNMDEHKLSNTPSHQLLFIGNSRGKYRNVVKWCIEKNYPIAIYGAGWDDFIDKKFILSDFVPNQDIPYLYNRAGLVLNDHWDDMRETGFISNRIWDVIGAGGVVLSDYVKGIESIKSNRIYTYNDRDDFYLKIGKLIQSKSYIKDDSPTRVSASFSDRANHYHKIILNNIK